MSYFGFPVICTFYRSEITASTDALPTESNPHLYIEEEYLKVETKVNISHMSLYLTVLLLFHSSLKLIFCRIRL